MKDSFSNDLFEPIRNTPIQNKLAELEEWYLRIDDSRQARKHTVSTFNTSRFLIPRYALYILIGMCILGAGFIPLRGEETVGKLIYILADAKPEEARLSLAELGFPPSQIVDTYLTLEKKTQLVLILPELLDGGILYPTDELMENNNITVVDTAILKEELDRPLYNTFFSNLPTSLSGRGFYTSESFIRNIFFTLASRQISKWLDNESVTYRLSYSISDDSMSFSLTPFAKDALSTETQLLYNRYSAISRAIDLLEDDVASVSQAKDILTKYRDSLEQQIIAPEFLSQ